MKLYQCFFSFFICNVIFSYLYSGYFLSKSTLNNNDAPFYRNSGEQTQNTFRGIDTNISKNNLSIRQNIINEKLLSYAEFEEFVAHPINYAEEVLPVTRGINKIWRFRYPIFAIIPPLPFNNELQPEMIRRSSFYREEIEENEQLCKDTSMGMACSDPSGLVRYFYDKDCSNNKCGSNDNFIIKGRKEYITGSVLFVRNGLIKIKQFDCGYKADYKHTEMDATKDIFYVPSTVVYLPVPQGYAFQHFCDGLMPKLVQIESLLGRNDVKYFLESKNFHKIVPYLLDKIGIKKEQIISYNSVIKNFHYFKAAELIIPCNAPPLNPVLWRRMQYILNVPALTNNNPRKIVLYLEREQKLRKRLVVNNPVVKSVMMDYFSNSEYEFRVFTPSDFENDFQLFSQTIAFIGPHGGAFQNMLFLKPGSIIMEFHLDSSSHLNLPVRFIFHRQAVLLGHKYYAFLCETVGLNMKVNVQTLETHLKAVFPKSL